MPSHLLLRVAWQFEDQDPKNQAVIGPCFRRQLDWSDPTSSLDAQQLCDDLATQILNFTIPGTKLITVKAYDLEAQPPNYPKATKTVGTSPTPIVGVPQQALCLSFYGPQNIPRKRGRIYIPAWVMTTSTAELSAKSASSTIRTKASGLVSSFAQLGGTNVDWIVWSRVNRSATKVENWFVDESWDIQRRRKLKSSQRLTGTTGG